MVGVAVNVTEVPEQMVVPLAAIETLAVKTGFTTMVTPFDVAGDPVKHGVAFDVITQVTTSLFANAVEVNVAEFVPAFVPLIFHWYEGAVPPFVGVAVNVTDVPAQIVVALAEIETLAVKTGFTTIVTPFDVAGEPVKHGVAFDVITQVTTSLFANVAEVNVAEFVPAFVPLIFH